jgi:Ca2+-binding EF-hand superfamily protein
VVQQVPQHTDVMEAVLWLGIDWRMSYEDDTRDVLLCTPARFPIAQIIALSARLSVTYAQMFVLLRDYLSLAAAPATDSSKAAAPVDSWRAALTDSRLGDFLAARFGLPVSPFAMNAVFLRHCAEANVGMRFPEFVAAVLAVLAVDSDADFYTFLFHGIDANGTGEISAPDVVACLRYSLHDVSPYELADLAKSMVAWLDFDGDGRVSTADFALGFERLPLVAVGFHALLPIRELAPLHTIQYVLRFGFAHLRALLSAAMKGTGMLAIEMGGFFTQATRTVLGLTDSLFIQRLYDLSLRRSNIGVGGVGVLGFGAMLEMFSHALYGPLLARRKFFFDMLDRSDDGALDPAELLPLFLTPSASQEMDGGKQRMHELLTRIDSNGDGHISVEEWSVACEGDPVILRRVCELLGGIFLQEASGSDAGCATLVSSHSCDSEAS